MPVASVSCSPTRHRLPGQQNFKETIIAGAIEPWFRGRRMASLTTADIRAYVAQCQEKSYATATINRELSAIKRMFSLGIQAGKLPQRPHIPMLVEDNIRKGFFERAARKLRC